jgi:hypothetical protein
MGYRQAKKLRANDERKPVKKNDERMSQASMANFGDLIFFFLLSSTTFPPTPNSWLHD